MAEVRRQKGDKTKVNANGVLVITRANGNVIKINGPKGTITRLKADGTVVKQKLSTGKLASPQIQNRPATPKPDMTDFRRGEREDLGTRSKSPANPYKYKSVVGPAGPAKPTRRTGSMYQKLPAKPAGTRTTRERGR